VLDIVIKKHERLSVRAFFLKIDKQKALNAVRELPKTLGEID
jgi:hypothetical protein